MDVAAVARDVGPRLRRERRGEAANGGDAADRLAHHDLPVGGLESGRVAGRQLLLAGAELGVVLVDGDVLPVERIDQLIDVVLRRGHPDRRVAQARIDRPPLAVDELRQRELVLESGTEQRASLGEPRRHPLQEGALAHGGRRAVERHLVGQDGARVRRVRQNAEGLRVGNDPELSDRPHPLDRLELVERVHRLHPERDSDPAAQPLLEPGERGRLHADGAVVSAPEEADEPQVVLACGSEDVHPGKIGTFEGGYAGDAEQGATRWTALDVGSVFGGD